MIELKIYRMNLFIDITKIYNQKTYLFIKIIILYKDILLNIKVWLHF